MGAPESGPTHVCGINVHSEIMRNLNLYVGLAGVGILLSMEPWAAAKKQLLVWRSHQLLCRFLAKGHLPRVSHQSHRSLMIRVIMKLS